MPESVSLTFDQLPLAHFFACCFDPTQPDAFYLPIPAELNRAVPKRQAEYLAGRWCVAQLYQQVQLKKSPPAYTEQGGPVWPAGLTGSITHTQGFAAAALASTRQIYTIGLDAEYLIKPDTAARVRDSILHPAEQVLLADDWIDTLTLIFSFKESLYKALNPILKRFISFDEVSVTAIEAGQLSFIPQGRLKQDFPTTASLTAYWQRQEHLIITAYAWSKI